MTTTGVAAPAFITRYIGDTWKINVTIYNPDGVTPIDISNLVPKAYLHVGPQPRVALTTSSASSAIDPTKGQAQFIVSATITGAVPADDPNRCFRAVEPLVRIQVTMTDVDGAEETYAIIPVRAVAA